MLDPSPDPATERPHPRFRIADVPPAEGPSGAPNSAPAGPVEGGPASARDGVRSAPAVSRTRSRKGRGEGGEARDQLLQLRCTEAERTRWRAKAEAVGMSVSALLREALEGAPGRRRRRTPTDPALLRELAKVGNNLNQLARWANRDKGGVPAVAVTARLVEIERELAALRIAAERAAGPHANQAVGEGEPDR